jgi:MFS family permease
MNVAALFHKAGKTYRDRVALSFGGRGMTYAEFDERAGRLAAGPMSDSWGRKPLLLVGAAMYATAVVLYPRAAVIPGLVAIRLIHGAGLALYTTASNTLVADVAPLRRRGEAVGNYGLSTGLGLVIGPLAGIAILQTSSFGGMFAVCAALSVLTIAASAFITPAPRTAGTRRRGVLLGPVIAREALLPALLALMNTVSWGGVAAFVSIFAATRGIDSPGLFFGTVAAMMLLVRVVSGRASDRFGRIAVIVPGTLLSALGLSMLALSDGMPLFVLSAIVYGTGFGAVMPALQTLAADWALPGRRGVTMSTYSMGIDIGSGVGAVAFGPLAQVGAFTAMWWVAAGFILSSLVVLLVARRRTDGASPTRDAGEAVL